MENTDEKYHDPILEYPDSKGQTKQENIEKNTGERKPTINIPPFQ